MRLLIGPCHIRLMTGLIAGPRSLAELRREDQAPATTLRGHLRTLAGAGVVEKRRHGGFPGAVDYRLTASGRDLLGVARVLTAWLTAAPQGPHSLGSDSAKRATRTLLEGWTSGIAPALIAHPRSLTALDRAIPDLSYPALERRLTAMRRLGLVRTLPEREEGVPFEISDWLRDAAEAMEAAASWERKWLVEAAETRVSVPASLDRDTAPEFSLP